ncbi:MAG: ferredoxin family protein [Chloroflexi bacterium]|nr:ferredoxin family protein [Chloroflexota bacterium]
MTHIITSLCLRDNGCIDVCPVECIQPGTPVEQWPTYYVDPQTCIDCGACVPECPYHAIFPQDEVPAAFQAQGGEILNRVGVQGHYEAANHRGEKIILETTRSLTPGEVIDLTESIKLNHSYFK